ncbi:MAG: PKD domain-containing protein [Candidatus Thermoplasmatota archaeon]|jgi:hypothetical protein|nr:PKD domain-containing protein [Candidatus Thermoplasmatota archaeon]
MGLPSEKIAVSIALVVLIGSLGAIMLLDRSHGGFGSTISRGDVMSDISGTQGVMSDPSLPEGLIILGAGRRAELTFKVENHDADNDIDTVFITVPGSSMISGSHTWFEPAIPHEWDWTITARDAIRYAARDDLPGRVSGGSSQYDVAGNIDDALDMVDNESETVEISVLFNAPASPGIRMGEEAITLEVADLLTEQPGSPRTLIDPYPYPYAVAGNGTRFLLMVLKEAPDCELEVMYGSNHLFAPETRSGQFSVSDRGFRFRTVQGDSVALLEAPTGTTVVRPLVRAMKDGLEGTFSFDMSILSFPDITGTAPTIERMAENYNEARPSSISTVLDLDMDSDGILNELDPDMDGDQIPNVEDPLPRIHDKRPVIIGAIKDLTVRERRPVTLTVQASDPEGKELNFTWTISTDPEWTAHGGTVTIPSLAPGRHTVTVTIKDPAGNTRTVVQNITSNANRAPVITKAASDQEKVKEGGAFTLSASATDPDGDKVTVWWTRSKASSWRANGASVKVFDLPSGKYTYTLHATDGDLESTDTVEIRVEEEDEGFPWEVIIIAVVILAVIALIVMLLTRKERSKEEAEQGTSPISAAPDAKDASSQSCEGSSDGAEPPADDIDEEDEAEDDEDDLDKDDEGSEPCPECGTGMAPGDMRCQGCGAIFEEVLTCSKCGSEVAEGTSACPSCKEMFVQGPPGS